MTNKKAINAIKEDNCYGCYGSKEDCEICAYGVAIEALEKRIPKKPKIISNGEDMCAYCECGQHLDWTYPESNGMWRNGRTYRFCLNCGQAIDWGDEE